VLIEKRIFRNWAIAFAAATVALIALAVFSSYTRALELQRQHLVDLLQSQAQLIGKTVAESGSGAVPVPPALAVDSAAAGIPGSSAPQFEFVLGRRINDQAISVERYWNRDGGAGPVLVVPGDGAAEPLRQALAGQTGVMTGRNFRGREVLAAYMPLSGSSYGLVAQVDLAGFRRPYLLAGASLAAAAVLLMLIGLYLMSRRIHPVLARLRESEIRYRSMIQSMDEGVVVIDERGLIRTVNPSMERLFGYTQEELRGRNVKILMPENYAEAHDGYLEKYVQTGEKHIIGVGREVPGLRRDGTEFPMQLFVGEMIVGEQRLFSGIVHDISERKKGEAEVIEARARAEQAAASKSQFLANMSHEIRTPMNGVLGMLELLSQSELGPAERGYVGMAQQSAASLLTLINDILDLSKIEAGHLGLERIATDLHDAIETTAAIAAGLAAEKDLRLNCCIAADVPARAIADPARLRQVLLNLLGNAIKFTERGEVNLIVEAGARSGQGIELQFSVEDTGSGIEAGRLEVLFDPFTQADSSISRRYGGTGLGLTISRHLVEMMGGKIWAESEPGQGSAFRFTAQFAAPKPRRSGRPGAWLNISRVLVIDDNETARRNARRYLDEYPGVQVETAADTASALHVLRGAADQGRPIPLLLLKHPLPHDAAFVRALREDEQLAATRIIVAIPVNIPATVVKDMHCDACLIRPVRRAHLRQALEACCGTPRERAGDASGEHSPAPGAGEWSGARLLLAEDTPINQQVCREMLRRSRVNLTIVENGQQAVDRVRQESFDLVLMDCQMPVMDGFTATRLIREWEEAQHHPHTPIVALTAHAMAGDRENCLAAGMDDYLSKPFRIGDLENLLRRWLPDESASVSSCCK
jgi:PAS domain S-box-containing protein